MAIEATLKLGGSPTVYNVQECEYEFNQDIDKNGKPCANPRGGIIKFTILSPSSTDTTFHDWMLDKIAVKDGSFEFDLSLRAQQMKKSLIFEFAHCISLNESFNCQKDTPMITKIVLSAAIISFGSGNSYSNNELFQG